MTKSVPGLYELTVTVEATSPADRERLEDMSRPHAIVSVVNHDDIVYASHSTSHLISIESHLNSFDISVDKKVAISAKMTRRPVGASGRRVTRGVRRLIPKQMLIVEGPHYHCG